MLESEKYRQKLVNLHEEYFQSRTSDRVETLKCSQSMANCMEFASANLRHLLPSIPLDQHGKIIDEILFNQDCAALDEDSFFLLDNCKISDPSSVLLSAKRKPVIFCTFHFGSYRLINALLCRSNINYILPVASDIYAAQKERYAETFRKGQDYFNFSSRMEVVDAEAPTAALTLARKVRAGWSLLVYIDGNTGVQGAVRRDAKMLKTSLLGKPIFARKGGAFLSHFLNVPIIPVLCERTDWLDRSIRFHEPIYSADALSEREAYCLVATAKLYSILGDYLKRLPEQWEGWLDLQKYLDIEELPENAGASFESNKLLQSAGDISRNTLVFNHQRFGLIAQNGTRVLLNKDTYKLLSLPEEITRILDSCREPKQAGTVADSRIQIDVIAKLVSKGILTVASP